MDKYYALFSEAWKIRQRLRGPVLWGWMILMPGLTGATTLVLPPAALPDMENLPAERFKLRWPQVEIPDGNYPIENGFWVTYQHGNLTYFVGPYEDQERSAEGRAIFDRIRNQLVASNSKFENSRVGVLELNIDPKDLKQGGGPTPGQIPTTLDGKLELPSEAANPGVRSVSTNQPPPQTSPEKTSEEAAHHPPGEFTQNGGGQVFAGEGEYLSVAPAFPPFLGRPLASSQDLSVHFPPVGIQGRQNSCTGWTVAYALKSYHERLEEGWELVSFFGSSQKRHVFSPAYVYNQINEGKDEGAKLVQALGMANTNGICSYVMMPYKPEDYYTPPSPMAHDQAQRYKIDFFSRVDIQNTADLKAYLTAGFPVVAGMLGDPDFEDLGANEVWKKIDDKKAAGHALTAVGYDDGKQAVLVYNSWGTRWAKSGLGWIAYDLWTNVVKEAYIAKDAPNGRNYRAPERSVFKVAVHRATLPTSDHDVLRFSGTATVPVGYAGTLTVEVLLEDAAKPVPGLHPSFQTVHGQAATLSDPITLPTLSTNIAWQATMPRTNLGSTAFTNLTASAVLFIDQFGVLRSPAQQVK